MESERIELMPPSMEQAETILEAVLESENELNEFLFWVPDALTLADSLKNTLRAINHFEKSEKVLRFVIIDKYQQHLVGVISLIIFDQVNSHYEVGYWLRSTAVGKGYASEAIKLLETYALSEFKAKKMMITTALTNVKSQAVALRCGYEQEAILTDVRQLPSGKIDSTVIYSKLF